MSHEILNAAALLFLAGAAFYLGTISTKDDGGGNGCSRRGCGRMPAGIGCNHRPRTEGPASGFSQGERDERI